MNPIRTRLQAELDEATRKAAEIMARAEKERPAGADEKTPPGRELTAEERKSVQDHLDEAKRLTGRMKALDDEDQLRAQIAALTPKPVKMQADGQPAAGGAAPHQARKSVGQLFVESPAYQQARAHASGRSQFSAGIEVPADALMAVNLSEAIGSGAALVQPDVVPGIFPLLTRRIMVTDLLAPGTTDSAIVEYLEELAWVNAAAERAETVAAAEDTLTFQRVQSAVRSIAHFLPVTNEMLEDVAQTQSYVDGRLRLGVALAEENAYLNGNGAPPNILGILANPALGVAVPKGANSNADAIFIQIMALATASFLFPDGIVINPGNWARIVLSKTGAGQYIGGGPFSPTPMSLWGLPCAVTPLIVLGTALVGAYKQGAQRFVRKTATVTATNSHADFFTRRLVAVMAEMRAALAVYRPGAFGIVNGLDA